MNELSVPTPALIVDLAAAERNINRMAAYAKQHDIGLRPHTKTHKSIAMARRQVEAGAVGLTAAKVGELELMAEATDDLLLAYPPLDPPRAAKIVEMAKNKTVRVAVDSRLAVEALESAAVANGAAGSGSEIGVLIDLDVGYHRTGVQTPGAALELAMFVDTAAGVRLDGILCYPGQLAKRPEPNSRVMRDIQDRLEETLDLWRKHGLEARVVSGGSTPTAYESHQIPALTEIRPGTYIFNDRNSLGAGCCQLEDCAARVLCTVISDAVPGKVVLDAGSKTLTSDRWAHDPDGGGYGLVVEHPEAKIVRLSEEHGELDITACGAPPKLGARVNVIPNHVCPCVNLQDQVWLRHKDGELDPLRVDARGRLS